jgi:hypothetical protein
MGRTPRNDRWLRKLSSFDRLRMSGNKLKMKNQRLKVQINSEKISFDRLRMNGKKSG